MPYVCIVSLCLFACISTCALGILKTCFIDEPRLKKSLRFRVKNYKALYKCCILLLLLYYYINLLMRVYYFSKSGTLYIMSVCLCVFLIKKLYPYMRIAIH